jgi:hypothetical protein
MSLDTPSTMPDQAEWALKLQDAGVGADDIPALAEILEMGLEDAQSNELLDQYPDEVRRAKDELKKDGYDVE